MNVPAPSPRVDTFAQFSTQLVRMVRQLMAEHAHADVVVTIKDGAIQVIRVNRSYLPDKLPQV